MQHKYLPPPHLVCEGYVFTGVCLCTGGVCPIACWDTPLGSRHPQEQTPLGSRPLPESRHPPPPEQTPPRACWEIRTTSGRYTSYWNAYLFLLWLNTYLFPFKKAGMYRSGVHRATPVASPQRIDQSSSSCPIILNVAWKYAEQMPTTIKIREKARISLLIVFQYFSHFISHTMGNITIGALLIWNEKNKRARDSDKSSQFLVKLWTG